MGFRPNILIVVAVPLRADHLSCYGWHLKTSPNIDSLASEGTLFEQAYSTAAWTPPAHASLLTGLYPSRHGVVGESSLDHSIPTMPKLLSSMGYRTVAFAQQSHIGSYKGLSRGFQEFYELWRPGRLQNITSKVKRTLTSHAPTISKVIPKSPRVIDNIYRRSQRAGFTTRKVISWLAASRQSKDKSPFFLLANYIDPHHPYEAPRGYRYRFSRHKTSVSDWQIVSRFNANPYLYMAESENVSPNVFKLLSELYDAEIYYLDRQLGRLFAYMRGQGILDKTFVILISPHGENLGEHDLGGHQGCLYEPIVHIPLIMRCPNVVSAGVRVHSLVQLTDVLPTLLDLVGFDGNNLTLQGTSLLRMQSDGMQREFAVAEWEGWVPELLQEAPESSAQQLAIERCRRVLRMLRQDDYKYIWASDGHEELFNLADDPRELCNLIADEPRRARTMARRLRELLGTDTHRKTVFTDEKVEEAILNDLRALGYRI